MMNVEELELIVNARQGDNRAMEALYSMNREMIFRLAFQYVGNSADAEDLLQEIFIKAFSAIKSFDPNRGGAFSTWVYRICVNTSINFLKRKKLEQTVADSRKNILPGQDHKISRTPERNAMDEEIRLASALDTLSAKQRMIFTLKHYQGLKIKEIATIMKCSEGSVKKQLFRAVNGLRTSLHALGPEV